MTAIRRVVASYVMQLSRTTAGMIFVLSVVLAGCLGDDPCEDVTCSAGYVCEEGQCVFSNDTAGGVGGDDEGGGSSSDSSNSSGASDSSQSSGSSESSDSSEPPPLVCTSNDHCEANEECHDGECVPKEEVECDDGRPCSGGDICWAGRCVTCTGSGDCDPGLYCSEGECVECTSDTECGGQRCVTSAGRCAECTSSAQCGPGTVCEDDLCV